MKWDIKRDIFALIVLAVAVIIACYYYTILPQMVASHYNGNGVVDSYSSKLNFVLLCLCIPIITYILSTYYLFSNALKKYFAMKFNTILILRDVVITFAVFIMTLLFASGAEGKFPNNILGIGLGLLFILFGNYLPKIPSNYFFGIRTPWTLSSELVWCRTHKISGALSITGGLLIILFTLLRIKLGISILVVLVPLGLYSVLIYPYFLSIKLEKGNNL
ncbi:MAG: SdpI family protein [Ignavibacteriaceae bacterium]